MNCAVPGYDPSIDFAIPQEGEEQTLIHLLDRLLDQGVVVSGDIRISVAGVDLLYVGLKVLLASVDTAERYKIASRFPEAA
jgi:gas vesicle structural protein